MNVYFKNKPKESKYRSMLETKEENLSIYTAINIAVASLKRSLTKYFDEYKVFPDDISCEIDVSGKHARFNCYEWFEVASLPVSCTYDNIKIEMISESKARIECIDNYSHIYERKQIFIINGVPKAGKDTLIEQSAKYLQFNVVNTSTIDMVKDLASSYDLWDGENKTDVTRNMLSELKRVITKYSNSITDYICKQVLLFLADNSAGVMFIHCREPEEIGKLKDAIYDRCSNFRARTLVVRRDEAEKEVYGNDSDANVLRYYYSIEFYNNSPLEESAEKFGSMIDALTMTSKAAYEIANGVREYGRDIVPAKDEPAKSYEFKSDEARALMYVSVRQLREGIDVAIKEFSKVDETHLLLSAIDGVISRYNDDLKKCITIEEEN